MLEGLVFAYFWLSQFFTLVVNSAVEFLHCVDADSVTDVLEVHSASEISEKLPAPTG